MRDISKGEEPNSLVEYRIRESAGFEDLDNETKQTLREQLVSEQHGLCCYCCGRISPDNERMNIEHWRARSSYPEAQLTYRNLLASCKGNPGQPKKFTHCDHHKGDKALSKNPSNPEHAIEKSISFLSDGTICSSDKKLNQELGGRHYSSSKTDTGVLNLNAPILISNRRSALDAFKIGLQKRGSLQKFRLKKLIQEWSGHEDRKLEPYAPVIAYWLRKRLKR